MSSFILNRVNRLLKNASMSAQIEIGMLCIIKVVRELKILQMDPANTISMDKLRSDIDAIIEVVTLELSKEALPTEQVEEKKIAKPDDPNLCTVVIDEASSYEQD